MLRPLVNSTESLLLAAGLDELLKQVEQLKAVRNPDRIVGCVDPAFSDKYFGRDIDHTLRDIMLLQAVILGLKQAIVLGSMYSTDGTITCE